MKKLTFNEILFNYGRFYPPTYASSEAFSEYIRGLGAKSQIVGKSILSKNIELFTVGEGKIPVLILGAHHGSEYMTAAILHLLIYTALCGNEEELKAPISLLLKRYTVYIVPVVNPDGVNMCIEGPTPSPLLERQMKMAPEGFGKWQANARGVDLNHNYDCGYLEYKREERRLKILPGRSLYSGEFPESEPESRCIANLVRAINPCAVISLHSQGEEIYCFPKNSKRAKSLGHYAAALLSYTLKEPQGTAKYGGLCDYTGEVLGIPSLTIEIGKGENPLPAYYLPSLGKSLSSGILRLITAI